MPTDLVVVGNGTCMSSASDFATRIMKAIDRQDSVDIDLQSENKVDLSILQLIVAARSHAADVGCTVSLVRPRPPAVAAELDRAGFLTAATPADIDFWFHGERPQ